MSRPAWPEFFMRIAHDVATRGTCDRKRVGAAIVIGRRMVASGYNGSIAGMPHCDDVGHDMKNDHCVRTVHAEVNAVAQAAQFGIPIKKASLYVNTFPCWDCFKVIVSAGITEVFYDDEYRRDERVDKIVEELRGTPYEIMLIGPKLWRPSSAPLPL